MKKSIKALSLLFLFSIVLFSCGEKNEPETIKTVTETVEEKTTDLLEEFSFITVSLNAKLNLNLLTGKEIDWDFVEIEDNPHKSLEVKLKDNVLTQAVEGFNEVTGGSDYKRPHLQLAGKDKDNKEYKATVRIADLYHWKPTLAPVLTSANYEWVLTKSYTVSEKGTGLIESDVKEEIKLKLSRAAGDEINVDEGSSLLIENKKTNLTAGLMDLQKTTDSEYPNYAKYNNRKLMFIADGKEMKFQYIFLGNDGKEHDVLMLNLIEEDKVFVRDGGDDNYPVGSKTWLRFERKDRAN